MNNTFRSYRCHLAINETRPKRNNYDGHALYDRQGIEKVI